MLEEVPKNWVITKLGELVTPSRNRVSPSAVRLLPYVGLENVEAHTMKLVGHGFAKDIRSSSVRFASGDVLLGKMRPNLNKVWVAEFEGVCSAEFLVFSKQQGLNSEFLALRLNAEDFVAFASNRTSGERPRVDFEKLSDFLILLPPTSEQENIVRKFYAAWSAAERAQTATRRARERLDRYGAAVLRSATTGELTRTWRHSQTGNQYLEENSGEKLKGRLLSLRRERWEEAEGEKLRAVGKQPEDVRWKHRYPEPVRPNVSHLPELPQGWIWMSIDELTIHLTSGPRNWSKYYNQGTGTFLLAQNVRPTGLDLSFRQIVGPPAEDRDRIRSAVAKDDILVTIVGANTGDVCTVPCDLADHFVCQSVALIRLADPALATFVSFYLASKDGQERWRQMIYGAGRPHLSFEHLRATAVPVPPTLERNEIIRQVRLQKAAMDKLASRLTEQFLRTAAVRQSLLKDAFAGRLLSQDPEAEPASVLLKRIQAHRQFAAQRVRNKPMQDSQNKSVKSRRPLLDILREHGKPITPEQLFSTAGFEPSQVDQFYRELLSIRDKLVEHKPVAVESQLWPHGAQVLLELRPEFQR